jgi:uncharacterized membrane protein YqaE (UPF0057 family)
MMSHENKNPSKIENMSDVTTTSNSNSDIIRVLLAIVLPPVGVFLQVGLGLHFWLNILLTIMGYVPGIVHAVWIILRK